MSLDANASTRDLTLKLLLREGEVSAAKLARSVGISVQAMRRHLRILQDDGLVEASSPVVGPGRPSNLWQLTVQGQNLFNSGSQQFALDLLGSIELVHSSEMIGALLDQQAIKKAETYRQKIGLGNIKQRLEQLVSLLHEEGYWAEFHPMEDGVSWYLNEFHCSIKGIAEQYPIVCEHELKLIRHTFSDCSVERVKWRIESGHSCGFLITPN